jgi:hypothetical protein
MSGGHVLSFPKERTHSSVGTFHGDFEELQRALARFNRDRVAPGLGDTVGHCSLVHTSRILAAELEFINQARAAIAPLLADLPSDPESFVKWFEGLKMHGPGQADPLFPWLAKQASLGQMRWFLEQEVAGEAGFDDLVAMTQVKMPERAKLEMARNYWDEMGRGDPKGLHGRMLDDLAQYFAIHPRIESTTAESLALANTMMAFAFNRHFAFHSVGALGVIEMTAPGRSAYVSRGLDRLGVPKKRSHYFALHAVLDVKHSEAWNTEVLFSLVAEDRRRARPIAEGALMRLACGSRCFERYRTELQIKCTEIGHP